MILLFSLICLGLLGVMIILRKYMRYSTHQKKIMVLILAISMAIIAFHAEARAGLDLSRHFMWMDNIRSSGVSLYQLIFKNPFRTGGYPSLISFNVLRYLICILTKNNHWLPCICVFIDYIIVGYIILDWYNSNSWNEKVSIITPLLCCTLLPPLHAFSGMRNATAACIIGLAIYLYLFKKSSVAIFCILAVIAVTMHPSILITIPFVFLSRIKIGKKGLLIVLILSLLLRTIANWLVNSRFFFISSIAKAFLDYSSANQYRSSVYPLWADTILVISFLGIYFLFGEKFKTILWNDKHHSLYAFLIYYMCYILGNIGNYDLFLRPCYVLGVFSPVLASFIENKTVWSSINGRLIQEIGKILCIILSALASFMYIRQIILLMF